MGVDLLIGFIATYIIIAIWKGGEWLDRKTRSTGANIKKTHVTLDGSYTSNGVRYTRDDVPHLAYRGKEHILNEDGYGDDGYDYYGYDRDGYDRSGFNKEGIDRNGCNIEGVSKRIFFK